MAAAITYIYPLYGTDTARLDSLLAEFRELGSEIPGTTTRDGFDNLTQAMRNTTAQFRDEAAIQMTAGHGKSADLAAQAAKATAGNPWIEDKRKTYWTVRKTSQLAAFDAWAAGAEGSLDTLESRGYDISRARRTLDVIVAKRPDLVAALDSQREDRIAAADTVISPLMEQFMEQTIEAQGAVSEAERMQFMIDQGYRAVYRADSMNGELLPVLLDIGEAEDATRKLKGDLAVANRYLATGNLASVKNPLRLVKTDLKDLSMAYRDIANTADLPAGTTSALRALVITLDSAADQVVD